MMSPAILRVSSGVSACIPGTITGVSRPFTSTVGGRPGEKNKSLIFMEVRSIAVSSAGVDIGSAVGAGGGLRISRRGRRKHWNEEPPNSDLEAMKRRLKY